MKLIYAIINSDDAQSVQNHLTKQGYTVTKLASTGGFLKVGNTTFLIGVDDQKVEDVIGIIKQYSSKRTHTIPNVNTYSGEFSPMPVQVTVGGATVFVTDIERFEKI